MRYLFHKCTLLLFLLGFISGSLWSQNKIEKALTYDAVCFYTIDKSKFDAFIDMKAWIDQKKYRLVLAELKKMQSDLNQFSEKKIDRAYELWYVDNYVDFKKQVMTACESMQNNLSFYEKKLKKKDVLYYEHRFFLELYLAFKTEYLFPEFWFMTQERYFSKQVVRQLKNDNAQGNKLFEPSSYYSSFDALNRILKEENDQTAAYLGMENDNVEFVTQSFWSLNTKAAQQILKTFQFNDSSMDVDSNRAIRAIKKFLGLVTENKIYLLLKINKKQP